LADGWTYVKTQTSSVTTAWGVRWDEDAVARDLMQNFFDANRDDLEAVQVETRGKVVEVSAPAAFELERLFYLGSEKGKDDVGKYGEGFKAASLCILRDYGTEPLVISGRSAVRLRVAGESVAGTDLVPLIYDFYRHPEGIRGTRLILNGVGRKLATAMRTGLEHFFYPGNPRIGRKLWTSPRDDVGLYESNSPHEGSIYYRGLKRGTIDGIPVSIRIDREFSTIEKRTAQDRDRLAFGKDLMTVFYKAFARAVGAHDLRPRVAILERSRSLWQDGHALIRAICENLPWQRGLDAATLERLFGKDGHFAECPRQHVSPEDFMQIATLEERWTKEGRKRLPAYFVSLGVVNALRQIAAERSEEIRRARRPLTAFESQAVEVLKDIAREFAPEIMQFFEGYRGGHYGGEHRSRVTYSVANDKEILGAFKRNRAYDSAEVCLVEEVFVAEFPEAIATFLHEHAHIFGYDGSRAFTDALTHIIETIIRLRAVLDRYEVAWDAARAKVAQERSRSETTVRRTLEERLAALDDRSLRALVAKIPLGVKRAALESMEHEA